MHDGRRSAEATRSGPDPDRADPDGADPDGADPDGADPVVALVGPTASGKSAIAYELARRMSARAGWDLELVSVDSMAVYRGMDIGTAKPTAEARACVRYHLVDLVEPGEEFTVRQFQQAARTALTGIADRGNRALLVGGTGLHLRAIVDDLVFPGRFPDVAARIGAELEAAGPTGSPGERDALAALHHRLARLDPVAAARIEPGNRRRLLRALEVTVGSGQAFSSFGPGLERYPPSPVVQVGIRPDPAVLDARIADRFERWMDQGLLEEVRALSERPGGLSRTARQALGYRELLTHLEDGVPLAEAVGEAIRRTRVFARRQMAWFRRDPRIVWMHPDEDPVARIESWVGRPPRGSAGVGDWQRA
jgi:tRNA dimethylallyltransferase